MRPATAPSLTDGERERVEQIDRFVALGERGVHGLLQMLSDKSWTVRRAVVSGLASLGDDAVGPLCTWLREIRSSERGIAAAVDALVASTGPGTDAAVLALADSPAAAVVADAAQILGRRGAKVATEALGRLIEHPDDNVAVLGIEAIGRIGGAASVEPLVRAVLSDNFFRTFAAIGVLGSVGDPRAIRPLADLLLDSRYAEEAARALGKTGDRGAIAPLASLLTHSSDSLVRLAVVALAELIERHQLRFGPSALLDQSLRESVGPAAQRLMQSMSRFDAQEQAALCALCARLDDPELLPALVKLLDGASGLTAQVAQALERLARHSESAIRDLLLGANSTQRTALLPQLALPLGVLDEVLRDPDPAVRALACEAAARIGDTGVIERLFELLADKHARVSQAALVAIQALGGNKTEPLALAAASSPDRGVRRAALRILAAFGFRAAYDVFIAALADPDERLCELATYGLAFVDHPDSLARLLEQASAPSPRIRAAAMRGLGHCASEAATVPLRRALTDPDPWVRYFACQALGRLGCEAAGRELAERLKDEAGQVRIAALEALAQLRSEEAWELLHSAVSAEDQDVRRAALIGVGLSGNRAAVPLLIAAARSSDSATRLAALSGLAKFSVPEALTELTAAAASDDPEMRGAAVSFLSESGSPEADRALVDLVGRVDARHPAHAALSAGPRFRISAVLAALRTAEDGAAVALTAALVRMKSAAADAALFEAFTFPNTAARKAAARALAEVGGGEVMAALAHAAERDPDPEVKNVSRTLLARD